MVFSLCIAVFSHSVVPDSLRPCRLQHTRLPCPSASPGACPNPCPLSRWCHPTISSSISLPVMPSTTSSSLSLSSCPQSFPAWGSFLMSQRFTLGAPKYQSFSFSINPFSVWEDARVWAHWLFLWYADKFSGILCSHILNFLRAHCREWQSSLVGSDRKESACNVGDPGSIPGSERSPGKGNGNPLQYSCLENSTDRGDWWTTVHGVTKSRTQMSN